MDYLLLFVLFTFVSWIVAILFSGDIFSPASLFALMFFFSGVCAIYSKENWGFSMYPKTFWTLTSGIVSFLFVSFLIQIQSLKKRKRRIINNVTMKAQSVCVTISLNKAIIILCIYLALGVCYLAFAIRTAGGVSGLLSLAATYRNAITQEGSQMPFIGRLSLIFIRAMSTTLLCIVINNCFSGGFKKNHGIILTICLLFYVALTLLSGERTSTLRFAGLCILCFSILWQRNNNYKPLVSIKYIILGTILAVVGLYGFSAIRYFVGRKSELDALDYISFYAGGPIYNFDRFISTFTHATYTGEHTFIGLLNNIARLGFGEVQSIHRATVVIQNRSIFLGNVYTCFYDYYSDFSIAGVIILTAIYSIVINNLYFRAKYAYDLVIPKCIDYIFVGTTLFFASFTEQFYSTYITISTVEMLIIMYVTYFFVKSKRVSGLKFIMSKE